MTSDHLAGVITVLLKTIPVTAAIIGAAYLMYCGKSGWGWLLFVALWLGTSSVRFD